MKGKIIAAVVFGLLISVLAFLPSDVSAASSEAQTVLKSIDSGSLDGKSIEVVTLDKAKLDADFSTVVQTALDQAKNRKDGKITRIVIPDGTYQPHGRALEIYSNTILDLRGSGAQTAATSDDYKYVTIYQTDYRSSFGKDPISLRCGHQDNNGGDNSKGYDFYKNMTVLGGTFVGHHKGVTPKNGAEQGGNAAGNVRFGHATNVRVIGTWITDNHGGHHLELGACNKVLVADCSFRGYTDGKKTSNSNGTSLEAVQLDISHRENNNFAFYGAHDDLPTINATITDCTFKNVRRGVGTHHAVFGKPYNKIVVKNNSFDNIRDKAIYFVYTKNADISKNTINSAVSGICFQYMVPIQQFQPNKGAKMTAAKGKNFTSTSKIHHNKVYLDDTKSLWDTQAKAKYGIRVGGQVVTKGEAKAYKIPAGTFYILGVKTYSNTVDIAKGKGKLKKVRAAFLVDYAAGCSVSSNTMNLRGKNEGTGEEHAGILVSKAPNVSVTSNTVRGITNGAKTDGILITACSGAKSVNVKGNKVYSPKRYGIHCNKVTNKKLSVLSNTIDKPGASGVKITSAKMKSVSFNTVIPGKTRMKEPCISVTYSTLAAINSNKVSGTKVNGIMVNYGSYAGSVSKNTVKNTGVHGILIGDNGKKKSTAKSITGNTISKCKRRGISINGKAGTVKGNKITGCGYVNQIYFAK